LCLQIFNGGAKTVWKRLTVFDGEAKTFGKASPFLTVGRKQLEKPHRF
jgi:hypothetical protein